MITSPETFRRAAAALPRFSVAALVLALALAFTLASMVGIAAWSINSGGVSSADVAAAHKAGYQEGLSAGTTQGRAQGLAAGRKKGYATGHKAGYASGLRVGRRAGFHNGRNAGYKQGYAAGLAVPRAPAPPAKKTKTGTKTH